MAARFVHIILAHLILFSSSGLLINQHYCRNELKHSALYAPAKSCHGEVMANCPMHAAAQKESKGCCDDESHFLKHKQEQAQNQTKLIDAPVAVAAAALLPAYPISFNSLDQQTIDYLNYKPPLITRDFPVSLQTFLL